MSLLILSDFNDGWLKKLSGKFKIYYKGYIIGMTFEKVIEDLCGYLENFQSEALKIYLNSIRGHFGIVITSQDSAFLLVDKIRSIPIFYSNDTNTFSAFSIPPKENCILDEDCAIEILMSGYVSGSKTLCKNIFQLNAGEYIFRQNKLLKKFDYYQFLPKNKIRNETESMDESLTEVFDKVIKGMIHSANGRQIILLLSAGYDSRIIASFLKKFKYQKVLCVTYGHKRSFEVNIAKEVSKRLGFRCLWVPMSRRKQRKIMSSDEFNDYLKYSDTLANSPIVMDFAVISYLKNNNLIDKDAIFVNGNTGDFISGGHIIKKEYKDTSDKYLVNAYIEKHYSLWECLKNRRNMLLISNILYAQIKKIKNSSEFNLQPYQINEFLEWNGRQSKFVSSVQRGYEFFGYDWRMPLWDPIFMNFWENIPIESKLNQKLYKDWIHKNNWEGVWNDIEVNNYSIASFFTRFIRFCFKLFFLLIGKKAWKKFDKKIFWYFLDNTGATAISKYLDVILDDCGARNRNSWIAKKYIFNKGIRIKEFNEK